MTKEERKEYREAAASMTAMIRELEAEALKGEDVADVLAHEKASLEALKEEYRLFSK